MSRAIVISGLGAVSAAGIGVAALWEALTAGRSVIGPLTAFDGSGFDCRLAGQIGEFSVRDFVPKTYRKATKVMARDIELAVAAADLAARDAKLATKGSQPDNPPDYDPVRVGAHIGAGLIAAELNELTSALIEARDEQGRFDYHRWGREGMTHLTPLWLLKYLPNMLACHVTIIHDTQGPSNTITCNEASSLLSIGESLRVIERGQADLCFCGGADSKVNPMAFLRQMFAGKLTTTGNDEPARAVRPFDRTAAGSVVGEGGGIVILEALETFEQRAAKASSNDARPRAYAQVLGFGASQTVNPAQRNVAPDAEGRGIAQAIRAALRDAQQQPEAVDLVVAFGCGSADYDAAEAAALRDVLGSRLAQVPVVSTRALVGNCGAGGGGLDLCAAAMALHEQTVPAIINRDEPLPDFGPTAPARSAKLEHALVVSTGLGGQNAAMLLKRMP